MSAAARSGRATARSRSINGASGAIEALNGTLLLDTGNTILNSGFWKPAAGGTLLFDDDVTNSGLVTALSGGKVVLAGVEVAGGFLSIDSSGTVEIASGPNGTIVTLDDVDVLNAGVLEVDNAVTLALDAATISGGTITNTTMD